MKAVVRAILLDPEARGAAKTDPTLRPLREPVLMVTGLLRALNGVTDGNGLATRAAGLGQRPYYVADGVQLLPAGLHGSGHVDPRARVRHPQLEHGGGAREPASTTLVYSGITVGRDRRRLRRARGSTSLQFEALADDAAALVDGVSDALVGGPLPCGRARRS